MATLRKSFFTTVAAFLCAFNLLSSCHSAVTPGEGIISSKKDVSYELEINPMQKPLDDYILPRYRFVATGSISYDLYHNKKADLYETCGYITGLDVYDDTGVVLLTVDFTNDDADGIPIYLELMKTMGLHVVDVNFDGCMDVIILNSFSGANSNTWYNCWLFNPDTTSFVRSESFSDICNPSIDPEKQLIYSTGGSGANNQSWFIYRFIDGEFVPSNH